ncbi:hypothetical protein V6N13_008945 [Hibiscus sabdariffa]|uniref:Uncharacterized protein n=1 Tax=Hibiscus sabdariffa TaxID=183260 RepID=A0ABR2NRH0_9ROSI
MAAVAGTVDRFPTHKASVIVVVVFKCKTVVLDEEQRMLMAEILLKSGLCSFPTPGHGEIHWKKNLLLATRSRHMRLERKRVAVAASRSAATAIQAPFLRAVKALKYLHLSLLLLVTLHFCENGEKDDSPWFRRIGQQDWCWRCDIRRHHFVEPTSHLHYPTRPRFPSTGNCSTPSPTCATTG